MSQEKYPKPEFDFEAVFETNDYLYFYEHAFTEERIKKEISFLVKQLELDKSMRILDLACGHGRHANRLAELGYNVTGVDISQGFLEIAKKDAKDKRLTTEFIHNDMREIAFREEFDRVLLLFTSFGYFEDEDNVKVIKNVANALKPEGLFCFDTFNRDVFLKYFLPYIVVEKGNDLMIDRNTFDVVSGKLYSRRIVIRNGKRKDKPLFVRLYNFTEISDLLKRERLGIYKVYKDWDAKPFTNDSRKMIIFAKKR